VLCQPVSDTAEQRQQDHQSRKRHHQASLLKFRMRVNAARAGGVGKMIATWPASTRRRLPVLEFELSTVAQRPTGVVRCTELVAPKRPVGSVRRPLKEAPQQWAPIGRRHSERLRRGVRLEAVRAHYFGSPPRKSLAGSRNARRMARRPTTSVNSRSSLSLSPPPCCSVDDAARIRPDRDAGG
jgi:hypothetical protein